MPDRVAEHYDRNAHAFDLARRRDFVEQPWLDRFLLAVPRGGHILDLGCGGGEPIDRYLIDTGHNLTGVDVSARMIALARTRFARHVWLQADMRKAAVGRSFQGILAWDSLFHLTGDDQAAVIEKAARWLEPGGALLFNSEPARDDAAWRFGEDLFHAGLEAWRYGALFEENGLIQVAHAPEDRITNGRTVWLARKLG